MDAPTPQDLVRKAYAAFNARDIPTILTTLHPQVRWARAWEGDYATGHDEAREYWLRQWQEIDPHVVPTGFRERSDGLLEVTVQQVVKDKQGATVFEGVVTHLITPRDGLLGQMDIERN